MTGATAGYLTGMTEPEQEPHVDDFEDPEDFADAVGVDPTPQQVDEYLAETEHKRPPDSQPNTSG
ncbi:hypothetical protein KIPE111705_16050 [Kibdelosporangium persicum]